MSDEYIPGVCNIGGPEVRLRKIFAWIGLLATLGILAAFIILKTAPLHRLLIFFPAATSALGFLQARERFCIKYGFGGAFNVNHAAGQTETVTAPDARAEDRRKSIKITVQAVLLGLAVAGLAAVLP
jgi:hypothetical protein